MTTAVFIGYSLLFTICFTVKMINSESYIDINIIYLYNKIVIVS
jgi:hypothetical protein